MYDGDLVDFAINLYALNFNYAVS